ncbi:MAG: EamA family transporter [bacterium]|jgi:drug/metabolite transporter (DMT)-like permease|nr:EamA family transporter [bacterium]MDD3805683.1 EamA family transporter [bacterium]MDD4153071.1 EamA family transporter [bacterium]MDD4558913.1 EamA family transporter [bacterium]
MKPLQQIVISVLLGALGQVFIKSGVMRADVASDSLVTTRLIKIFMMPYVWAGLGLYIVSTLIWLLVLSRVELSFAYPLISLSYVAVLLISWLVFKEHVSMVRWAGVCIICLGVALIARS